MHHITSPRLDDQGIEQQIQSKGLTAPRITPQDLENEIMSVHYFTAADGVLGHQMFNDSKTAHAPEPLHLLTFCVIIMRNGFTVTGESACASPENFNAEIGKNIAKSNAMNKMWPLLGYQLKEHLHQTTIQGM